MIVGMGTDLAEISRFEQTLARFGDRFRNRVFTEREQRAARYKPHQEARRLAQFFAAKEATSKALGTGMRQGVAWRQIEVLHQPSGKPYLVLSGAALDRLESLLPKGQRAGMEVSLTDEAGLVHAVVLLYVAL